MKRLSIIDVAVVMNRKRFSKKFSADIVGGRARLDELIANGSIRTYEPKTDAFNAKKELNAWDVICNALARIK